jgi:hypothetical protein
MTEYSKGFSPIAYSYETAKGGAKRLRHRFGMYEHFLSTDYKNFDKTVPPWLIRIAFDILLDNMDFSVYRERGIPDASQLMVVWDYIVEYFIRTPIRMCTGERYRKNKGIASGSGFTQLVGSICNWIITVYALRRCGYVIGDLVVLGDDALIGLSRMVDLILMAKVVLAAFGMIINVKKSHQSSNLSDVSFLGYKLAPVPIKEEKTLWASLAYPETPDDNFDKFATRAMGLLLANFGVHEDFDRVCRIILKHTWVCDLTPSLRRMLDIMGISAIPKEPPDLLRLYMMATN